MVDSLIWFGLGAAAFWLATLSFLAFASLNGVLGSRYYLLPPLDTAVAGTAYSVLTLIAAGVLSIPGIDLIPVVRSADWVLSTPIIAYYLALVAGADTRIKVAIVLVDVLMILTGFAAVLLTGALQWLAFALGVIFLIAFVYLLAGNISQAAVDRLGPRGSRGFFRSLRDLTVLVWAVYPIVWALGPGLGVLQVSDQNFVFLFLDLTAKIGFMGIIFFRQYALDTLRRTSGEGALAD